MTDREKERIVQIISEAIGSLEAKRIKGDGLHRIIQNLADARKLIRDAQCGTNQ